MTRKTEVAFHTAGWILFVLCAVLFLASGIQVRDPLLIAGSVVFLLACFVFLIPLMSELLDSERKSRPHTGPLHSNGTHSTHKSDY